MKRKIFWIILLILLLLAWVWFVGRSDTSAPEERAAPATYAPGASGGAVLDQLLVDLRNDATDEQILSLQRRYGLKLRPNSRFSPIEKIFRSVLRRSDLSSVINRLRAEPAVEHAELDALYGIPPHESEMTRFRLASIPHGEQTGFPNDPKYRFQWHLDQVNMPGAWPRSSGKAVIVAVIDTGVAYKDGKGTRRVPDLAQTRFVEGYDFVNDRQAALDDHGHGTHVAGTIAQSTNNGIGVAGIAYRARIMPLKVLSSRGFGSVADIAEAVRFAADHGARVINMSLGGSRSSKILASAVKYARDKGVLVVCAAGNEGRERVSFPAAYPGAMAVAATQFDRTATFYSNYGKEIDIAAPGGNTRVDQNGDGMPDGVLQNTIIPGHPDQNDYLLFMGTSMASPHVAGVAALVAEQGVTKPDALEKLLKNTARHPEGKRWDPRYGAGIVDAAAALGKTSTTWGGYKLGLALTLGLLVLWPSRQRGRLRPGAGTVLGLILGSSGLFFLPALKAGALLPGSLLSLLSNGLPSWDLVLFGSEGHGHPLFFSALIPLGLTVLLLGLPRLRSLLFGLALGVGSHLLFHAFFDTTDISYVPNLWLLDQAWLLVNGLGAVGLASLLARRQ